VLTIQSEGSGSFLITVEDNGKGFVRQAQYDGHFGLENMTARASESQANLVILSEPRKGTTISISKSFQS
jgi:signal transduction histidine kinase